MSVDPLFAQWLQADADYVVRTDDAGVARWGASSVTTERLTAIATRAAAKIEGDRQFAFFARGPFAEEVHEVVGVDWVTEIGRIVTFANDQLGYAGGIDVMVLGVDVSRSTGMSAVTVLRPLRGAA